MCAGGRHGMDYMQVINSKVVCVQPPEIFELDQLGIVTKANSPFTSSRLQKSKLKGIDM